MITAAQLFQAIKAFRPNASREEFDRWYDSPVEVKKRQRILSQQIFEETQRFVSQFWED